MYSQVLIFKTDLTMHQSYQFCPTSFLTFMVFFFHLSFVLSSHVGIVYNLMHWNEQVSNMLLLMQGAIIMGCKDFIQYDRGIAVEGVEASHRLEC